MNQRASRIECPIARVEEVIQSRDGHVRSCWLRMPIDGKQVLDKERKTKKIKPPKLVRRGIEELCLLESDIEQREVTQNEVIERPINGVTSSYANQSERKDLSECSQISQSANIGEDDENPNSNGSFGEL